MWDHFGISLRGKLVTFRDELFFELAIVLNDTIMDDSDFAWDMRMRVTLRRLTMGRPAGMSDTDMTIEKLRIDRYSIDQFLHFAHLALTM